MIQTWFCTFFGVDLGLALMSVMILFCFIVVCGIAIHIFAKLLKL